MKPLERVRVIKAIAIKLQEEMTTSQINSLFVGLGIHDELEQTVGSKRVYVEKLLAGTSDRKIESLAVDLGILEARSSSENPRDVVHPVHARGAEMPGHDQVFVVHGRDENTRRAMFGFLRALGLRPLEWSDVASTTGRGAPYIGDILQAAFSRAAAVVVLITPDDEAKLRDEFLHPHDPDYERRLTGQARPNVLFEAGMALGHHPDRTILVEFGALRPFSDVAGRHTIRFSGSPESRHALAERLRAAGCEVNTAGTDWLSEGRFEK